MASPFVTMEAVNSVALSHPQTCSCVVCKAANGDDKAMSLVMSHLARLSDPQRG